MGINENKQIVLEFIYAINEHDIDRLCSLMTDEHKFIDAQGNEFDGKDKMRTGWLGYFAMFPDYKIEITDIFTDDITVGAFGFASGTYAQYPADKNLKTDDNKNYFYLPASWKAVIGDGRIKLWQVYCDTKLPSEIIERNKQ